MAAREQELHRRDWSPEQPHREQQQLHRQDRSPEQPHREQQQLHRQDRSPEQPHREQQCREYLRQYRIPELLHRLSALLLYHRPERPREFLIQALERVKAGRRAEGELPDLMDDANLGAMFGLMDVLGQGHVTAAQLREALKTLGLGTEDLQIGDDANITLDTFKEEVLLEQSSGKDQKQELVHIYQPLEEYLWKTKTAFLNIIRWLK